MIQARSCRWLLPAFTLLACSPDKASSDDGDTGSTTVVSGDATAVPTTSGADTTAADAGDTGDAAARPNWHQDIAPLTVTHCQSCHVTGGIAPFGMETYEQTRPWAPAMAADIVAATMPPWHALETDECQPPFPFKHDARLDDATKQLFIDWSDLGAPEGDPALAVPLPDPPSLDLENTTTTVRMASELTVEAAGTTRDFFHCLSIDPGNAETVYVDGMQILAGNPAIVHHVLVYVDTEAKSAAWSGGVKRDCGGGAGITGAPQLIAGWVPGGMPIEPPSEVATEIPPGTRLILNVHYHAAIDPEKDSQTGVALRWKTTPPKWSSLFQLVGAPGLGTPMTGELEIPAGAEDHIESYAWKLSPQLLPDAADVRVWAALNHMHKVGVDMRVWIEDGDDGTETCMLQTPTWDFNWQRSYAFDVPIAEGFRIRAGDTVHVRCTYDNVASNPGVAEILAELGVDDPFDVELGEGTFDEMCLTGLGVAIKLP